MDEQFTLFWDGPFSQWHPSSFLIDDQEYSCAEQYMMAEKARLFGDAATLEAILETEDPRRQKALGRAVEDFDEAAWQDDDNPQGRPLCWLVVWIGNAAKFGQSAYLREELLATRGTTLVEASPHDRLWGIGRSADEPGARERSQWRGLNWLGEVLTELRERLIPLAEQPGLEELCSQRESILALHPR